MVVWIGARSTIGIMVRIKGMVKGIIYGMAMVKVGASVTVRVNNLICLSVQVTTRCGLYQ